MQRTLDAISYPIYSAFIPDKDDFILSQPYISPPFNRCNKGDTVLFLLKLGLTLFSKEFGFQVTFV